MILLPMVVSAYDIAVQNGDGKTIYYNYTNNGTELAVTRGDTKYTGNIVIPDEVTYMTRTFRVTIIGGFYTCSGLTSVTLPNSVKSIGKDAFYECSGLTSVTIPNSVKSIGDRAFGHCTGLTSITIPNSVTSIGYQAFCNCTGLTSVTLPNSVTSIGKSAFKYCSGLTSVTIPNSVTSIGEAAFQYCDGLKKVIVSDIAAWCGIAFADDTANPLSSFAGGHLYSDENTVIKDLVIPNSVTSIGNYAFSGCSGLTSVTIPNSVTSIGKNAFRRCSGLTSITIPNSVTSIGESAFIETMLTSVKVESGNAIYDSRNNCNAIIETGSNTLVVGCKSTVIPNSVTSIGKNAFRGCSGLTSVTIPNSVTSIGEAAFFGCTGLTSITIPNSVTSIGDGAFYNCSGLKKVIVKDIAAWCGINFGSNPLSYAKHLYSDEDTEITNLIIPNSVTSIGDRAFYDCEGLTSVTIPNSVTSIGYYAFEKCSGLTSVTIPNSVTSIRDRAFYGCSGLTSVTIPNSVTSIGGYAFAGVDIPTIISFIENPFTIKGKTSDNNTFSINTFNNATLYVPKGTIDKYKTTEGWKDFIFIEEGDINGIANIPAKALLIKNNGGQLTVEGAADGEAISVYTVNGVQSGSAISQNGAATIDTSLQSGSVAIVKIGDRSIKLIVK